MAQDLSALKSAIKVVADAINDLTAGTVSLASFQNVLPDLIVLLPSLGQIGPEASSLATADYEALCAELAADLSIANDKVKGIVNAAFPVLNSLITLEPQAVALIKAFQA